MGQRTFLSAPLEGLLPSRGTALAVLTATTAKPSQYLPCVNQGKRNNTRYSFLPQSSMCRGRYQLVNRNRSSWCLLFLSVNSYRDITTQPSLPTHASKVYYRWTMLVPSPCPAFDSLLACGESLEMKLQQLANETRVSDIQNNLANHLL